MPIKQFMQRAAASNPQSRPDSQFNSPDTTLSQRQKISDHSSEIIATPSELREGLAEDVGETKWVLSTMIGEAVNQEVALRVAKAGFSEIDEEALRPDMIGRRSFGKFNRDSEASLIILTFQQQRRAQRY